MKELEADAQHLRRSQRCHGESEAAQPQRGQADKQRGARAERHRGERRERQGPAEHGGADSGGIRADAEERLLAERELAGEEQQVGRERGERKQAHIRQDAERVLIHGGRIARRTKSSR